MSAGSLEWATGSEHLYLKWVKVLTVERTVGTPYSIEHTGVIINVIADQINEITDPGVTYYCNLISEH
nr:hypothetical protein CFP56_26899 [Quercus suber]